MPIQTYRDDYSGERSHDAYGVIVDRRLSGQSVYGDIKGHVFSPVASGRGLNANEGYNLLNFENLNRLPRVRAARKAFEQFENNSAFLQKSQPIYTGA